MEKAISNPRSRINENYLHVITRKPFKIGNKIGPRLTSTLYVVKKTMNIN